jgi:hypothetical protein
MRAGAALVAAAALAAGLGACSDDADPGQGAGPTTTAAAAGGASVAAVAAWKTWVLSSADQIQVAAPPAAGSAEQRKDFDEVTRLARTRTPEVEAQVRRWSGPIPTEPWTTINNEYIASQAKDPPLSSRNLAYTHAAMFDALVAAYHWKDVYKRQAPLAGATLVDAGTVPSYPSEHAAIAGAASRVLGHLYPGKPGARLDDLAEQAADSRVAAGVNTRSDVEAGLALGRAVAEAVIAKADGDGSNVTWDGKRPVGIGAGGPAFWAPPPGAVSNPIQPLAGGWKTWVLSSGSQLRSTIPPPPAVGTPAFTTSAKGLLEVKRNLTDEQKRIAKFWEGAAGTPLPAGILNQVVLCQLKGGTAKGTSPPTCDQAAPSGMGGTGLSAAEATRLFALINIAMADAGGAVWDAKFTYWYPRPENGISDSGIEKGWKPHLPTPSFPAYPSGSAGYAGAVEGVMTALFPADAAKNRERAEEQAVSRQYAGIHWDFDAKSIDMGRAVAKLVLARQGVAT